MRIGFIGAGRVGSSLGKFLRLNGADISGYYSRSASSALAAAEFVGADCFGSIAELCASSGVIVLTVPDGELKSVYESLAAEDINGRLLCHCSGAMSSDEVFDGIEKRGAHGCSVHPLFPVSSIYSSYKELGKAYFCLEGSREGTLFWQDTLVPLGVHVRVIDSAVKSRYHAACTVMSNLVCALADESLSLMLSCGFEKDEALAALRPLAESNLNGIFAADPSTALTGPVERNDVETVRRHLDCLTDPSDRNIYAAASLRLAEMAQRRHPERDYSQLTELLQNAGA